MGSMQFNNPLRDCDRIEKAFFAEDPIDDEARERVRERRAWMLFALCALILIASLAIYGCAANKVQDRIDALNAEADTAVKMGDRERARDLREEAARIQATELPAAIASDDNSWAWAESAGAMIGTLVGGPAVGAVVGGLAGLRRGRRKGAMTVAEAIEAGKAASPALAELFKGGQAHDAMRAALTDPIAKAAVIAVKDAASEGGT